MASNNSRIPVPMFKADNYEMYESQVEVWAEVCGIDKTKQASVLWLTLPDDHASDIKAKIYNEIKDDLKTETGVTKFLAVMAKAFKPAEQNQVLKVFLDFFVNMKRGNNEKIMEFITRFDKTANAAKKKGMEMSQTILGLKLIHDGGLSDSQRNLVLVEIDFEKKDDVYEKAKLGLNKYMAGVDGGGMDEKGIKLEAEYFTEEEEALLAARGFYRGPGGRGGGGSSGAGGAWSRSGGSGGSGGGAWSGGRGAGSSGSAGGWNSGKGEGKGGMKEKEVQKRPLNPTGHDGERLLCRACGSYRHLMGECPHSWEKMKGKVFMVEEDAGEEESFYTMAKNRMPKEEDDVILFTGSNKEKISSLGSETLGRMLLDSGCTRNVCGESWWLDYYDNLDEEDKNEVRVEDGGEKRFRFGGGEVLTALRKVTFPANLAGKRVRISSHVVRSPIPLLWSKPSMMKARVLLDLPEDRARILGSWTELDTTSAGHHSLSIRPQKEETEYSLVSLPENDEEKKVVLVKLHRQLGHPRKETMVKLLKNVNCDDKTTRTMVAEINDKCQICKRFTTTPPRPVVSLPPACEFNEVLTVDLKDAKVQQFKFILYMIDGFTRQTVGVFIKDKKPATVVHNLMLHWVSVYGRPARLWSDVGGEFNNDTMRQAGEALGMKVETGAGYAAWMNGLNERNHAVVDRCYGKVMKDNPSMDPVIALAWAVTAKNGYPMHGGYSSFQLVFGKQPTLPNLVTDKLPALEGVTTSQSVAAHINAMYGARKEFMAAQCDEKIRRALRHKVRAVERRYLAGEEVYYKRDSDRTQWRGPATVIGNRGALHFLVHQGELVRVAACRLVHTGEAEEQMGGAEPILQREEVLKTPDGEQGQEVREPDVYGRLVPRPGGGGEEPNYEEPRPEGQAGEQGIEAEPGELRHEVEPGEPRHDEVEPRREAGLGEQRHEAGVRQLGAEPAVRGRVKYPKAGDVIQFKEGEDWREVTVIGRGCKASSRVNPNYFNVRTEAEGAEGVDLDKSEWRFNVQEAVVEEQEEEVNVTLIPIKEHGREECVAAKKRELAAFDEFGVYEEVQDKGQEALSSRWVLTDKSTEKEKKVKARLVARGFEEKVKVQADSPTGSKETLHMLLTVAATWGWKIKSGDVKSAYLQGERLDREVYMVPPLERRRPGFVWRLVKAVYGMNDSGRKWYFKVEEVLVRLGCKKAKLDHCFFFYRSQDKLQGIMLVWVDDIFYAGTEKFENEVMKQVAEEFLIGRTEEETFIYIGLAIKTTEKGITLDQEDYIKNRLVPAALRLGDAKRPLDKEETLLLRRLTGQINWAATQSRPDISFTVVELSSKIKTAQLEDLKKANKVIVKLAATPFKILFPRVGGKLRLVTYSDAAFRNLPDQISSGGGHVIFLTNEEEREAAVLAWSSNKIKRVVGSTLAAEALSLQEALSHAIFLRAILAEILDKKDQDIVITSYVDSNNLFQAVYSTKFVEDKRLRLDIAQVQECIKKDSIEVRWVQGGDMLADCLTKKGANPDKLMEAMGKGRLPHREREKKME